MKNFIKGAALLLGGAALGVLGKNTYDAKGKEIKKTAKDIAKNVKTKLKTPLKKNISPKKEK